MDGALFALSKYRRTNEIVNRNAAAGMPSRSEGRGGLFKVPRSGFLMNFREAHRSIMSASRKSIRYALRAAFEQTVPPSPKAPRLTQAGTGPQRYTNQGYIASITFKPLQGATLRLPVHSVLDT